MYEEPTVQFSDSVDDEISALNQDLRLVPLAQALQGNESIPENMRKQIHQMISILADIFSSDLPKLEDTTDATLRTISRDINLARLLRERGLFRLYRLINQRDANNSPVYMSLINHSTGAPFATQEEFVGWFCREAKVARSLVFQRMAIIDRVKALGFSLEEAFVVITKKPFAIREILHMVADWGDNGKINDIDPDVIEQIAGKMSPDILPALTVITNDVRNNPEDSLAHATMVQAAKPIIAGLLREAADHDTARDALDFVRHDLLQKPTIEYTWNDMAQSLDIELVRLSMDPTTREERKEFPVYISLIVDSSQPLPKEIRDDLFKRIPISNRKKLDL